MYSYIFLYFSIMTWKQCIMDVLKKQTQPMGQVTYWVLFVCCGLAFVIGIVSGAAAGSFELIKQNPEIAADSWVVQGNL